MADDGEVQSRPEVAEAEVVLDTEPPDGSNEVVSEPAKVMRIGAMIRQLLEEVRQSPLDEPGRKRLRDIYDVSVAELSSALSPDLAEELGRLSHPFDQQSVPSEAELRVAQAQLVGWLEGLFHGIQAAVFAQQAMARQQLDQMRHAALGPGKPPGGEVGSDGDPEGGPPGVYL